MSPLIRDLVVGGFEMLARVFLILVPIVALLELLRAYGVLARLRRPLAPVLRGLGLSPASADPLLAGVLFGMVYGAGVILTRIREEGLPRRDVTILAGTLCLGHALPEDTLLFVVLGANGALVVAIRLTLVVLSSWIVRVLWRSP